MIIDEEFVQDVRLSTSIVNYTNVSNSKEFIPVNKTLHYLRRNSIIDDSILEFFYAGTSCLMNDKDYDDNFALYCYGKREYILFPYSICIGGAYLSRSEWECKFRHIAYNKRGFKIKGIVVETLEDLKPYFEEYVNGFKFGYDSFDNEHIDNVLTKWSDKDDYANIVFEYLTKCLIFEHAWAGGVTGFSVDSNQELSGAYDSGLKQGKFYRAWTIVFEQHKLFTPMFQSFIKRCEDTDSKQIPKEIIELSESLQKVNGLSDVTPQILNAISNNAKRPEGIKKISCYKQKQDAWTLFLMLVDSEIKDVKASFLRSYIQFYGSNGAMKNQKMDPNKKDNKGYCSKEMEKIKEDWEKNIK